MVVWAIEVLMLLIMSSMVNKNEKDLKRLFTY